MGEGAGGLFAGGISQPGQQLGIEIRGQGKHENGVGLPLRVLRSVGGVAEERIKTSPRRAVITREARTDKDASSSTAEEDSPRQGQQPIETLTGDGFAA